MLYQRDMKQVPLEESERFSNESRETKTKELALQSITKNAKNGGPIKTPGLFAFGFSSDWSKRRREKQIKSRTTFGTQMKSALSSLKTLK